MSCSDSALDLEPAFAAMLDGAPAFFDGLPDRESLVAILREILVNSLQLRRELDEIDPDAPLFGTGLRLDSIDAVELWVGVGMVLGVEPPDDLAGRLLSARTLNTLADTVIASLADEVVR